MQQTDSLPAGEPAEAPSLEQQATNKLELLKSSVCSKLTVLGKLSIAHQQAATEQLQQSLAQNEQVISDLGGRGNFSVRRPCQ